MGQKSGPVKEPVAQLVQGDPPRHPASVFGGGEELHRLGRPARGGPHSRAVPPREDRPEPLLPLVE
jgi:hypothetical protein